MNANQTDMKNFLAVRIFAKKWESEIQTKTLESLAQKGQMLPIPSLITMYMPSYASIHLGERAIKNRMSTIMGSLDINSIGGSGEQQQKRLMDTE